jgi:ubiquinone/menaquinone biosynthesis C-methylase UbiE
MKRVDTLEILDSDDCPPDQVEKSLRDIAGINRRFGGVSTSQALIERVAASTGATCFSLLEVASGRGEVPELVRANLTQKGITLDITLSDRAFSHLRGTRRAFAADALTLPFRDNVFDLISCNLFAHHLDPQSLSRFACEALRVSRCAVLINDLVRHPLHLALVYAAWPLMKSWVSRADGVASVRRAYVPAEMHEIVLKDFSSDTKPQIEIFRHHLFRMGIIIWKTKVQTNTGTACMITA